MNLPEIDLTKKQIIWLCRLYEPHIGGVERHVSELSQLLLKSGYSILVLTEQYDDNLALQEVRRGVRVLRIPHSECGKKISTWKWIWHLISKYPELRSATWHAHDVHWWILPFVCLNMLPHVFVTFHGYEHMNTPTSREIFWRKIAQRFSRGSILVGEWISSWYGLQPDLVTYGGARISPLPAGKRGSGVAIGRLEHDTGLLKALPVVAEFSDYSLDIYGEGSQKKEIEAFCSQYSAVRYKGVVKNVERVLRSASFVFASQYLSLLEAMQAGRMVIAYAETPLKKQYLESFPGKKWLAVWSTEEELRAILSHLPKPKKAAQVWAQKQAWESVLRLYADLWKR